MMNTAAAIVVVVLLGVLLRRWQWRRSQAGRWAWARRREDRRWRVKRAEWLS